jgi:trafficking protein particle complex subunit 10
MVSKSTITCTSAYGIADFTDYDPFDIWPQISEDFLSRLPLRNLHWKSSNRPLRSIQSLEIDLHKYDPSLEDQPHQIPTSLLERPYLNIMLVQCEVSPFPEFKLTKDNETYRGQVRKTIREWYNGVLAKRNQEWVILHVVPKEASVQGKPSSRFSMKGFVYDKIRADFNTKKDR